MWCVCIWYVEVNHASDPRTQMFVKYEIKFSFLNSWCLLGKLCRWLPLYAFGQHNNWAFSLLRRNEYVTFHWVSKRLFFSAEKNFSLWRKKMCSSKREAWRWHHQEFFCERKTREATNSFSWLEIAMVYHYYCTEHTKLLTVSHMKMTDRQFLSDCSKKGKICLSITKSWMPEDEIELGE